MLAAVIVTIVLGVVLMVLAWPPDDDLPPPARHRDRSRGRNREQQPRSASGLTVRRWVTSDHESGWHIAASGGPNTAAACGHHLRGPVRRYLGMRTPLGEGRTTCAACCYATALPVTSTYRPVAHLALLPTRDTLEGVGRSTPHSDPGTSETIEWPTTDPDEPESERPARPVPALAA